MNRESFFCPITHEVMQDPVIDPEGNSYERTAITEWLLVHSTSPITRAPLAIEQLAPNRALKEVIQEELKKANESGDTQWMQAKQPVVAPASDANSININSININDTASATSAVAAQQTPTPTPEALAAQAKAEAVELKLTTSKSTGDEILVHASIAPGAGTARSPADICCVVDISGSMGTEASVKTGTGQEEKHGLSLLDIVKHAVKTVVSSLHLDDRFALVVFSTTARVVLPLTSLKDTPKDRIFSKVESLQPEDTTNLWDGLLKGLEILKTSVPGRISALLLLTDGLPNISPPRGELAMLKKYKDEHKQLNTTINTFGFGYSIDTPLLLNLAVEGHGMHSFIPDASFVGTAFVNTTSNLLVTMGTKVTLALELQHGATIKKVLGGYQSQLTSWGAQVEVCSLQYGQTKDVVVALTVPPGAPTDSPIVTATLRYEVAKSAEITSIEASVALQDAHDSVDLQVNQLRLDFVSTIAFVIELVHSNKDKEAQAALADLEERVKLINDPRALALLKDISGQAKEAIIKAPVDYFKKWGRHYLPSLARAHLLQQCNNFKDPGIQIYGGQMFQRKRDEIDDIFLTLPPPKPSVRRVSSSYGSRSSNYSAPQSMSVYHNAAGPCFAGECLVQLASGEHKLVKDLVRGDQLQSPQGPAEVLCVIKTLSVKGGQMGIEDLVTFPGGLQITPFHPVRVEGKWHFPSSLHPMQTSVPCEAVYNFVLKDHHVMMVQGVECVTLGHGLEEEVVAHPYFGTQLVVQDLKRMAGWEKGCVVLDPRLYQGQSCMKRDKQSGLVCGFATSVARDV